MSFKNPKPGMKWRDKDKMEFILAITTDFLFLIVPRWLVYTGLLMWLLFNEKNFQYFTCS